MTVTSYPLPCVVFSPGPGDGVARVEQGAVGLRATARKGTDPAFEGVDGEMDGPVQSTVRRTSAGLSNEEVRELYEEYGGLVSLRCHAVLRNRHLVSDVVQTVFLKLMAYGAGLRVAQSKRAYINTVANNCCRDVLRRWERDTWIAREIGFEDIQPIYPFEERNTLFRLLRELRPFDRLIALQLYDGLNQDEISEQLGCTRQTINKRVARIKRLARGLE